MKQARKNKNDPTMSPPAARAKSLCPQGQLGREAKILTSDGVAHDGRETLKELTNGIKRSATHRDSYSSRTY